MRLITAAILILAGSAEAGPRSPARLGPCTIERTAARCGTVTLPEDPSAPTGRLLHLHAIVLSHTGGGAPREPVFVLAGGPGQAATDLAGWMASAFRDLRRDRDVVLVDQRGTGGDGRLSCPAAPGTFLVPLDAAQCAARLSRNANLRLYGTETFVEDIELERTMLGYGRIVPFGLSYGTRAAYVYARQYSSSVRAAVLMSPTPIAQPLLSAFAQDGRASPDAIVRDCLADSACRRAFPALASDAVRARARLTDPFRAMGLQFLQYSSAGTAWVPLVLTGVARGGFGLLDAAIARFRAQLGDDDLALGLHMTIVCGEDLPFNGGSTPFPLGAYLAACRNWPAAAVSPGFHDAARLSVPALVIAGAWDPVTSPRWARVEAGMFSPSQLVIVPKASHVLDNAGACVATLVAGFLNQGTADGSCVAAVRGPQYVLR